MTATSTPPVVTTTNGPVRGSSRDGIRTFLAVPYAAPPFGERRFLAPAKPEPWTEVRDCTAFGATAPAPPYRAIVVDLLPEPVIEGDDCLHSNVWSPEGAADLPVLVWFHGGSFQNGSNAVPIYDGTAFARDGVVCVSVNFRLGVDGFAHLEGAPDNRGLLDQITALEWVRDNIAAFGGDPTRVTIMGESAGAMGVTTLTAMPAARGLFQRVIAESGAGHHAVSVATATKIIGYLASVLGVEPTADAIAAVPLPDLLRAHYDMQATIGADPDPAKWGEVAVNSMPFEPVVDGASLPGLPYAVIAAGEGADVEVLVGSNDEEHRLFLWNILDRIDEPRVRGLLTAFGAVPKAFDTYVERLGTSDPGVLMVGAMSDWFFRLPAVRLAEARHALGQPTWVYEFGWRSPGKDGRLGACHALEIPFAFDSLAAFAALPEGREMAGENPPQALADDMHGAWVAFVRDGNPGWDAYGEQRLTHRFGGAGDGEVQADPEPERRLAWPSR